MDHCIELRENFRQKYDPEFAELLNNIRVGVCTPEMTARLKECCKTEVRFIFLMQMIFV
jgi:hypothetical protein